MAKKFRRRFRVPYVLFKKKIVPMCIDQNIFGVSRYIPVEFKIMVALRMLGRGNCADDVEEMSGVAESTCHAIFKRFLVKFSLAYSNEYIKFPTGDRLKQVVRMYTAMGFPMCCGSMDVCHVHLGMCREGLVTLCTGKEHYPSLAFQCCVGPNRECYYTSTYFFGSFNDKTITHNCTLCKSLLNGLLKDVEGILIDEKGIPLLCKGGYLVVDGGYPKYQFLIDPMPQTSSVKGTIWSEWLESIRKDVECFFGILKSRFRMLKNAIQMHSFKDIECAWYCAIILHNMLIQYDGKDMDSWEKTLDWDNIDPDYDDVEFDDDELMDNFEEVLENLDLSNEPKHTHLLGRQYTSRNVASHFTLRDDLVEHFVHLYKLRLVKWPKRSTVVTKHTLRVQDQAGESRLSALSLGLFPGLYHKPSDFINRDMCDMGDGLFSIKPFIKGNVIGQFKGEVVTLDAYNTRKENGYGGYAVKLNNSEVLDCYSAYKDNRCYMSFANDARNCMNKTTRQRASNNCVLVNRSGSHVCNLICNVSKVAAHTELAWDYSLIN